MNWPCIGYDDLREIMQEIMTVTPGIGQTRMLGAAMESQRNNHELDPVGTALRWRGTIFDGSTMCDAQMHSGKLMEIIR